MHDTAVYASFEDAERLCKRVLIMNKGSVVLVGSPDELRQKTNEKPLVEVTLKQVSAKILNALDCTDAVEGVKQQENKLLISVKDTAAATPEIVRSIVAADGDVLAVNALKPSLEEAYLKLIKGGEKQ